MIDVKNGCALISSASPFPEPSRFTGFLCRSFNNNKKEGKILD